MHIPTVLAAAAAVMPMVNAHGDMPAVPKILGLNVRDLKARNLLGNMKVRHEAHEKRAVLDSRQNTNGQCGDLYYYPGFSYTISIRAYSMNMTNLMARS